MARHPSSQPTDVELQILRILWENGPSIVREIHTRLNADKGTAYSTTVKMLSVMLEKGLVTRDESVRPQVYRAAASRQRTQKSMLADLLNKVYEGSTKTMMLHVLSSKKTTPEEFAEIRKLIDEMENEL